MRLTAFISIVPVSLALLAGTAAARPRYGGTLRVEMRAIVRNLDPADVAIDPLERAAKGTVLSQVVETLVRFDDKGRPQPMLAESWTHDAERRRWIFRARKHVTFHNGAAWSPADGELYYSDDRPVEQILVELARLKNAIVLRANDGAIYGTGPFKVAKFEPGKSIVLVAHEQHWAGRPYLDSVEFHMGRAFHDQAQDAQLGLADVTELPVTEMRRARQRGDVVALSSPLETLALIFDRGREAPPALREALGLALDRASIQNVLLQKMGEASAALLPQWLSGHALVFPAERNVARARQLNPGASVLNFYYDRQDMVLRGVAERKSPLLLCRIGKSQGAERNRSQHDIAVGGDHGVAVPKALPGKVVADPVGGDTVKLHSVGVHVEPKGVAMVVHGVDADCDAVVAEDLLALRRAGANQPGIVLDDEGDVEVLLVVGEIGLSRRGHGLPIVGILLPEICHLHLGLAQRSVEEVDEFGRAGHARNSDLRSRLVDSGANGG